MITITLVCILLSLAPPTSLLYEPETAIIQLPMSKSDGRVAG